MNRKEIICVLLNDFADWEGAFIAPSLNQGVRPGSPLKYVVKTLSLSNEPVTSIGGFRVLPDYDLNSLPENYAGIILIGGMSWFTPEAEQLVPLVKRSIENNKLVAGICNASVFLGKYGFLNQVKHTSNTLEYLKNFAGKDYTGDDLYVEKQAVRDGNLVTANGTGQLEFCREILHILEADTHQNIEETYQFQKNGLCPE